MVRDGRYDRSAFCPLGERAGGVEGGGGVGGVVLRAVRMRVGVGPRGGACASGGGTARIRWRCRAELARWGGAVEVWGGESAAGGW